MNGTVEHADLTPTARRLLACRILMGIAAVSALIAVFTAVPTVARADAQTLVAEMWRLYGYLLFAGLFALLALRPTNYPGLWELVILNKILLTGTGLILLSTGGAQGSLGVLVVDGALSAILIAAYVCCQGWRAGQALLRDRRSRLSSVGS